MSASEGQGIGDCGTVLIAGEEAGDPAGVQSLLTRGGYTVDSAAVIEAVARARDVHPHLMVVDGTRLDDGGLEACRTLRSDRGLASIPILLLTPEEGDAAALAGLEAGADDFVARNAAPELILARVHRLVRSHRLQKMSTLDRQLVHVGRLLAGVVHEIRGPLSVIRGSAELLRLGLAADHPDLPWVDSILRGTLLLQTRLEHLMSAVRAGPPQLQSLDVSSIIQETVDLFVKGLPPTHRGVQVSCDCGQTLLEVKADAGRLIQVLINVLTNAYQAITQEGRVGAIDLRVESFEEAGTGWVKIEVTDDGPGIPEAHLGRIFEPFFTTREGGTGYGLYLCSEILEDQGGRLEARNHPDRGACFTIWLPRANADREHSESG
jgi:signal transduction histidine kinase